MNAVQWEGKAAFPSKIVCAGRNFVEHIQELDNEIPEEPVIFIKPNSAISTELRACPEGAIHYEGELTFLIEAGELAAVGFGLDLTKRSVQSSLKAKGLPWERAKAFDGSAVFSDFVSLEGTLSELRLELWVNGLLVQNGGYPQMIHTPQSLLEEAASFLAFENGDLLMTGTPKGVGPVRAGDQFTGKVFQNDALLLEKTWIAQAGTRQETGHGA